MRILDALPWRRSLQPQVARRVQRRHRAPRCRQRAWCMHDTCTHVTASADPSALANEPPCSTLSRRNVLPHGPVSSRASRLWPLLCARPSSEAISPCSSRWPPRAPGDPGGRDPRRRRRHRAPLSPRSHAHRAAARRALREALRDRPRRFHPVRSGPDGVTAAEVLAGCTSALDIPVLAAAPFDMAPSTMLPPRRDRAPRGDHASARRDVTSAIARASSSRCQLPLRYAPRALPHPWLLIVACATSSARSSAITMSSSPCPPRARRRRPFRPRAWTRGLRRCPRRPPGRLVGLDELARPQLLGVAADSPVFEPSGGKLGDVGAVGATSSSRSSDASISSRDRYRSSHAVRRNHADAPMVDVMPKSRSGRLERMRRSGEDRARRRRRS